MTEPTPLQKAFYTIQKLKQLLQEQRSKSLEPIAIVGLSCRFPQANNKHEFWQLLSQGKNVITSMPEQRWQLLNNSREFFMRDPTHPYWGSFLSDIASFDAYFFGISPREAMRMDPQQRLLLEVAYEAMLDAGLSKENLAGSNTGVFVSLYANQFGHIQTLDTELDALFLPTGSAPSIAANRISYQFDLRGPSMVMDTSCSSSLVAAHVACLHLQNQLCDIALVGGVNINFSPSINLALAKAKMLSPDGQCKTFDAAANGYVQGEGVGMVVLKPLAKALQDHDRIYAIIIGGGVNQDGKTNGLTAPNGASQEALLRAVYTTAGVDPATLSYIECHGTGTLLGDPIEVQALGNILSKNRNPQQPCWLGAVKTNLGHLEPAAGIASIIKVALALQQAQITPHLNFKTPNPYIAFDKYHFRIPQQLENWPRYGEQRVAGISGFGFGGTNAHLVLREISTQEKNASSAYQETPLHIWQAKTYWPEFTSFQKATTPEKAADYPLHARKISSPLSAQQFEFTFDTQSLPELADTHYILHAGYYVEMLAYSVEQLSQKNKFSLIDLQFISPIFVSENNTVTVQLILQTANNDKDITFCSKISTKTNDWTTSANSKLSLPNHLDKHIESIATIIQRCNTHKKADDFYHRITTMGMPAGNSIRWTQQYWRNEKEILCEFNTPVLAKKNDAFKLSLHPGSIDACIQPIFLLLPEHINKPYVSSRMGKISYFGPSNKPLYLFATLKNISSDDKQITGDWCLIDVDGKVVIECEDILLTQLSDKVQIAQLNNNDNKNTIEWLHFPSVERKKYVSEFLLTQVATLLMMPTIDINLRQPLCNMGIDSLLAVALMHAIESNFKINYSLQDILHGASIADIVDFLVPQDKNTSKKNISATNPWITYRVVQANPKVRLFCFPFGGASAAIYRNWQTKLPDFIEVCPIQLPGREERLQEMPISDLKILINTLIEHLIPEFSLPIAFFGHSFGGLIAFELARSLRQRRLSLPVHIFASAYPAPQLSTKSFIDLLQQLNQNNPNLFKLAKNPTALQLTDQELDNILAIFKQSGVIDYNNSLSNKVALRTLLPTFIADMSIVKNYQYVEEAPLDLPITVFASKQDQWVPYADHFGWATHTHQKCELYDVAGGHLFIKDDLSTQIILAKIITALTNIPG